MTLKTTKGFPYPEMSDPADGPAAFQALADRSDILVGITPMSTLARDALSGEDLFDGRAVLNVDTWTIDVFETDTGWYQFLSLTIGGTVDADFTWSEGNRPKVFERDQLAGVDYRMEIGGWEMRIRRVSDEVTMASLVYSFSAAKWFLDNPLDMSGEKIHHLGKPTNDEMAATRGWVSHESKLQGTYTGDGTNSRRIDISSLHGLGETVGTKFVSVVAATPTSAGNPDSGWAVDQGLGMVFDSKADSITHVAGTATETQFGTDNNNGFFVNGPEQLNENGIVYHYFAEARSTVAAL